MNRRLFLKLFAVLPIALPFVNKIELPKITSKNVDFVVPPGNSDDVFSLISDDEIYIGGNFTGNLVKWDGLGNTWRYDGEVWTQTSDDNGGLGTTRYTPPSTLS